jgi:hypothetical protein
MTICDVKSAIWSEGMIKHDMLVMVIHLVLWSLWVCLLWVSLMLRESLAV